MKKNDKVELEITGLTSEGMGVGRAEGMAVFVPTCGVGDRILARIEKVHSSYAFGKMVELLSPSPSRIENDCPVFPGCGGCVYRHMTYSAELEAKETLVRENLRKLGGLTPELRPIIPSPEECRYRNKAQYPVAGEPGGLFAGFYSRRSHRVIPAEDCLLQPEIFSHILREVLTLCNRHRLTAYNEATHTGILRHIYLRRGDGGIMVCLVCNASGLPFEEELCALLRERFSEISSIVLCKNTKKTNVILSDSCRTLWGSATITDTICGITAELSPLSFYQVNRPAAEGLYRTAAQMAGLTREDILLDLYCGSGVIGLSMSHLVQALYGIEIVAPAVENARRNALRNGIENAEFLCCDAYEGLRQLADRGIRPSVIITDPPRKGCGKEVTDLLLAAAPRRIVMISCNSATLARDCAYLVEGGYEITDAVPVDLFPRTAHVETVALLSRSRF
ncbi:MAG: 23S rRNA (uracil(1939)-C(5))-methyltransferase RlmD [Oscillospiraceae bacterium]|nr:23S rRNA (uracil(1939)-C(5))-methyltransferase RlmD [Oscillospiraceae bacterium]